MNQQRAAELQTVLEGVPLPAQKRDLLAYASEQDGSAAADLQQLPDRKYSSLDEVGEALAPVQPSRAQPRMPQPHEESGEPPGELPQQTSSARRSSASSCARSAE